MINNTGKPFKILIADDDEDDVSMTRELFSSSYSRVQIENVADGQILMDILKYEANGNCVNELPQLILLDINMPRKNGLEALKEIKQDNQLSQIPIIIFSTSNTNRDKEKALGLGANAFISKPSKINEWQSVIEQITDVCKQYGATA